MDRQRTKERKKEIERVEKEKKRERKEERKRERERERVGGVFVRVSDALSPLCEIAFKVKIK